MYVYMHNYIYTHKHTFYIYLNIIAQKSQNKKNKST